MSKRILVAVDGSPRSEQALSFAVEEWPDATLTLLHVINPVEAGYSPGAGVPSGAEEWYESADAEATELLDRLRGEFAPDARVVTEVGRPAQTIVEVARGDEYDHVVLGSHGRRGLSRILLGSVAEAVVRDSPVPVTVVR